MSNIKIIKSNSDYEAALKLIEELMASDPAPDSDAGEKLALLATLIEDYETKVLPETLPTPVEAIRFRMEQQDLKPIDLVPYLGSRSKVSEILSGKRQLTLEMIRALESGLGIPAKVLIQKDSIENSSYQGWSDSLVRELSKRNYFGEAVFDGSNKVELLSNFFTSLASSNQRLAWKRTNRTSVRTDEQALLAWSEYIKKKATEECSPEYKHGTANLEFMRKVAQMSSKDNGPLLAKGFLKENGITLVIAKHLPKTKVDGVAILTDSKHPVVGLSLRFDRLDNFWFTLMHELAHVSLHIDSDEIFFDELENAKSVKVDDMEKDADSLAQEALIPESKWQVSPAKVTPSPMAAQSLANELNLHIAVVAGAIRHKHQNFIYLSKIVNADDAKVRKYFPNF
jgi:HTH-type transcriptional regulator / antitoxin HigA